MAWKLKIRQQTGAALLGALLAAATGLVLHSFMLGRALVDESYDLLFVMRGERPATGAVLVYLDEPSHQALQQSSHAAWNRPLHARLIERVTRAGAKAVVFDVWFRTPNAADPASDQVLAAAIKDSGRVILASDYHVEGAQMQILPPFDLLLDHAAGLGSVRVEAGPDLIVREHPVDFNDPVPGLSWVAAEFLGAPVTKDPAQRVHRRWVNYYGGINSLPGISYHQALDTNLVSDDVFRDRVVFVGARMKTQFAGERKDEYANPFSGWMNQSLIKDRGGLFMAGVEVQATVFLNLLRGDWLRRLPFSWEQWILVAFGLLFGPAAVQLRPLWAAGVSAGTMATVAAVALYLFARHMLWFPWLLIGAQIGAAVGWSVLYNSVQLYVQKRLYQFTLGLYLSPKLVRKFSGNPNLLKPGAEDQVISIMFTDIEDFTVMSQQLTSDELAKLMNNYFETAVGDCIHKMDGTVVKYIGDAIFAFWNAPDAQVDHAARAGKAALLLSQKQFTAPNGGQLVTRIGIHTGLARVGNFGSSDRVDYTALGESVNLASRLEGLNKYLGTHCVISRETCEAIGDQLLTRSVGMFQLKGYSHPVQVYELLGFPEDAESTRAWRDAFQTALNNYQERNLEFAEIGFRKTLKLRPEDGPSKFYLQQIERMQNEHLPEDWATHIILRDK